MRIDPRHTPAGGPAPRPGNASGHGRVPTVVITGSTRGLGIALAGEFLRQGCQVVVSGRSGESVREALGRLAPYRERVHGQPCDVTDPAQVGALWDGAVRRWGRVDVWINNAGVAQEYLSAWELPTEEVMRLVETNILGVMHGSRTAMRGMRAQGGGAIYNMEGWGSDGKRRSGLAVYGTTKTAVRYFTRALADEASARESAGGEAPPGRESGAGGPAGEGPAAAADGRAATDGATAAGAAAREGAAPQAPPAESVERGRVLVGTLSPGMMVTDFLMGPMARMSDAQRMRRIVNILGDRPETVAAYLVPRILANRRNHAHIAWLTGAKVIGRFLGAALRGGTPGRDLFAGSEGTDGGQRSRS